MKILLAVDGSAYTQRMLAYLAAHDELLGAKHDYTVVTVVPAIPPYAAEYLETPMVAAYHADQSERVLTPVRAFVKQQGWQANFVALSGHASELIAQHATEGKFDLLVLGSHGHGTLLNVVMGSVATRVLAACKTPALLIR